MDKENNMSDDTNEQTDMQTDEDKVEWRDNKSVAECVQAISNTKNMSDVTFSFKKHSERKLQGHKLILSIRSAVFEAMFLGPMAENQREVDVEDVEPDIFDIVLKYIYTDRADLNGETVLKCLYAARKYCLSGLVNLCSCFLENSISSDNVCTIYEQAKFFSVGELKDKCYTFIIENSTPVFQSDDIKKLSNESLALVLDDEKLQSDAILHFNTALRWANEKCASENIEPSSENKRKILGEILGKIRFPTMSPDIFANEVIPTQILSAEEQICMFQFMVTRTTKTPGRVGRFVSLPRHCKRLTVDLEKVGSLGTYTSPAHIFKIRSNFDISLVSLSKLNFQSLAINGNDGSSSSFDVSDFQNIDQEMHAKNTSNIVLRAGDQYVIKFSLPRGYSKFPPQTTTKKVCHTAAFGEMSIEFDEIPQGVNKITFCGV